MSLLIAVSGWDAGPWRRRLATLLPSHSIASLDEPFDRAADPLCALLAPSAGRAR